MKETIFKIIERSIKHNKTRFEHHISVDVIATSANQAAKETSELITEFFEWMTKKEAFYGDLSEKYFLMTTENKKFSTIEELFQYWLDNKSITTHDLQEIDKADRYDTK